MEAVNEVPEASPKTGQGREDSDHEVGDDPVMEMLMPLEVGEAEKDALPTDRVLGLPSNWRDKATFPLKVMPPPDVDPERSKVAEFCEVCNT